MPDWDPATASKDVLLSAVGIRRRYNRVRAALMRSRSEHVPIAAIDDPLFDT